MPAVYKPRPHLQCFCYNSPRCLRRHTGVSNTGLHPGVPKVGDLQIQPWCVWPLSVGTEHTLGLSEPPFLLLGKTADAHWPRQLVCGSGGPPGNTRGPPPGVQRTGAGCCASSDSVATWEGLSPALCCPQGWPGRRPKPPTENQTPGSLCLCRPPSP